METSGWFKEEEKKARKRYTYYLYELINDLTNLIIETMNKKGVTKSELARKMGVSKASISGILNGNRNMTLETLTKVAFALGCKPEIELKSLSDEFEEMEINLQEVDYASNAFKIA
jgi:transcriptional regulator with XRE-family HTH domain